MSRAERAQRIDQVADRPLVHARHAGRARSRRRTSASAAVSGRNAVPALPRKSSAASTGNAPPAPCTIDVARHAASRSTRTPSARSASQHPRRVVGVEQVARRVVVACGQRREQQRAVGDALRAGQRDRARRRARSARGRGSPAAASRVIVRDHVAGPSAAGACDAHPTRARAARRARTALPAPRRRRRRASRSTRSSCVAECRDLGAAARRGWRARCRATSPASSPAMRVKSRKPLAAKPKIVVARRGARRARRPARTPAGAAGATPRRRSRRARPASSVRTRAPHASHSAATRAIASASVSAIGVSTTLRLANSVGERRRRAGVLGAGDRMARDEARHRGAERARAPRRSRPAWCCRRR